MRGGPDGDNQDALWNFHAWYWLLIIHWSKLGILTFFYKKGLKFGWPDLISSLDSTDGKPSTQLLHPTTGNKATDQKQRGPLAVESFRRGPSSVESIRRGEVGFAFDTPYVICCFFFTLPLLFDWLLTTWCTAVVRRGQRRSQPFPGRWNFSLGIQESSRQQLSVSFTIKFSIIKALNYFLSTKIAAISVGRLILTKRPGTDDDVSDADVEDITSLYKNPDAMSRQYQRQNDGCFNSLFGQTFFISCFIILILILFVCLFFQNEWNVIKRIFLSHSKSGQGMQSPYSDMRGDRDRDRDGRDMMHYPGSSGRRLSIVDSRKPCPWYDEPRHMPDPGSPAERLSAMNAARSVERTQPMFDVRPASEDVYFDLIEQEKVAWGQPFNIQVHIQVWCNYATHWFDHCFWLRKLVFVSMCVTESITRNANHHLHPVSQLGLLHRSHCPSPGPLWPPVRSPTRSPYVIFHAVISIALSSLNLNPSFLLDLVIRRNTAGSHQLGRVPRQDCRLWPHQDLRHGLRSGDETVVERGRWLPAWEAQARCPGSPHFLQGKIFVFISILMELVFSDIFPIDSR